MFIDIKASEANKLIEKLELQDRVVVGDSTLRWILDILNILADRVIALEDEVKTKG